ncbi:MAG: dihydrofolate reductase [Firmicutes bacterium HGW-Firmicutes-21]|nr:MAG: dihydrofolate reductase [Firmicutes bacterium HGW-Firmicutes-21]
MSNNVKVAVIGGDLRQLVVAKLFAENGIETAVFGFDLYTGDFLPVTKCRTPADALWGASAVILPLPCSVDKESINAPLHDGKIMLDDLLNKVTDEQIVCGGMLSANRPNIHDYYEREELKILNAIPTAEGAIALALDELPITLHDAKAVVLGYGRIGKALAERLKGLGCVVTVVSKKESDLALCESSSHRAVQIRHLSDEVSKADVIFNTIPAMILNDPILGYIDKNTLIIDLAGRPGGVDFDAAKRRGIEVIWALSLPGKVAPVTAGRIIYKTVCNILKQEGVL